jgi:hypothetical protein
VQEDERDVHAIYFLLFGATKNPVAISGQTGLLAAEKYSALMQ